MDPVALFIDEALPKETVREWLLVSVMHNCLTGTDGLYNPLLLGAVNNVEDLAASVTDFATGVWLNPQLDSGYGFGPMCSEIAFSGANSGGK